MHISRRIAVGQDLLFLVVTVMTDAAAVVVLILLYRWPDLIPGDFLPVEYRSDVYVGLGGLAVRCPVGSVQLLFGLWAG